MTLVGSGYISSILYFLFTIYFYLIKIIIIMKNNNE